MRSPDVVVFAPATAVLPPDVAGALRIDPLDGAEDLSLHSRSLKSVYAGVGRPADMYGPSLGVFIRLMENTSFMSLALSGSLSLLSPLRWSIFKMIMAEVEFASMIDCVLTAWRPRRVLLAPRLPRATLIEQGCRKYGIPVTSLGAVKQGIARHTRYLSNLDGIFNLLARVWHRAVTDRLGYRFGLWRFAQVGKRQWEALVTDPRAIDTLFVSALSNWQLDSSGRKRREVLLERLIEAAEKQGERVVILGFVDDYNLAVQRLSFPRGYALWDGMSAKANSAVVVAHAAGVSSETDAALRSWSAASATAEALQFNGFDFGSMAGRIATLVRGHVGASARRTEEARWVLRKLKPKKVVAIGELSGLADGVCIAARELAIPTLGLAHAVTHRFMTCYIYGDKEPTNRVPHPDLMAFWGKREREIVTRTGPLMPRSNVRVVGSPKRHVQLSQEQREGLRQSLGVSSTRPLVLCSSNNRHHFMAKTLMRAWTSCQNDFDLLIKLHPRELNFGQYWIAGRRFGIRNMRVVKDVDFLPLLDACDVHVSFNSTTIIEAAWLGKPTILVDEGLKQDPLDVVEQGVAWFLSGFESLDKAIRHVMSPAGHKQFMAARAAFLTQQFEPEQSLEDVYDELARMAGQSETIKRRHVV